MEVPEGDKTEKEPQLREPTPRELVRQELRRRAQLFQIGMAQLQQKTGITLDLVIRGSADGLLHWEFAPVPIPGWEEQESVGD